MPPDLSGWTEGFLKTNLAVIWECDTRTVTVYTLNHDHLVSGRLDSATRELLAVAEESRSDIAVFNRPDRS